MRHVFVESNFLIELLRPVPSPDATNLFARNDGRTLQLHIPWCSQSEASRTLKQRIVAEDLGFTEAMMKFAVAQWLADKSSFNKVEIDKLKNLATNARNAALSTLDQRIQDATTQMMRIDPTPAVVQRTVDVFKIKSLKPFDEMVLGAVLCKANELYQLGERDLHFCNLDGDLGGQHTALRAEYSKCGLAIHQNFRDA